MNGKLAQAVAATLPPTLIAGIGLHAAQMYPETAPLVAGGAAALLLLGASWSATKRLPQAVPVGLGAAALAAAHGWVATVAGLTPPLLYSWLASCAVCSIGHWMIRRVARSEHLDREYKSAKVQIQQTRLEISRMTLAEKFAATAPEPVVVHSHPVAQALDDAVFQAHGARSGGVVVAQARYGWAAELAVPITIGRDAFVRQWDKVATRMGAAGEFVIESAARSDSVLIRCVTEDLLSADLEYVPLSVPFEKLPYTEPIVLGIDHFGEPASLKMTEAHTLIAGSSGNGKSSLIKLLILRVAALADSVMFGVDMKPGAPELGMMEPLMQEVATTPRQVQALFEWLKEEMHRRGEIIRKSGTTKWNPLEHGGPIIYVFVDELAELVRQDKSITEVFESLMALTRAYGMRLIAATQQPSRGVFGGKTDTKGNFKNKLCLPMETPAHYQFMDLSPKDTTALDAPGKFMLAGVGGKRPAKAEYVSDSIAAEEVARLAPEIVKQGGDNRFILPVPDGMNNAEAVAWALRRGPMLRREIEAATGLTERQVLDALRRAGATQGGPRSLWALAGTW